MKSRGVRKELVGTVISDKMQKTVVVETQRRFVHAQYGKVVTRRAKFYAHDEARKAKAGDVVRIRESRPLSKLKRWRVVEILRSPGAPEPVPGGAP